MPVCISVPQASSPTLTHLCSSCEHFAGQWSRKCTENNHTQPTKSVIRSVYRLSFSSVPKLSCLKLHAVWHQCKKITVGLHHPPLLLLFLFLLNLPSLLLFEFFCSLVFFFLVGIKVCMMAHMERCLQQVHTITHMHTQAGGEEPHHEQGAR